ncbi:hypothetical protein V2J09_012847, partial [Rumex salicifolius]
RRALEKERSECGETAEAEGGAAGPSKRNRSATGKALCVMTWLETLYPMVAISQKAIHLVVFIISFLHLLCSANANALKLSCELLKIFVEEAVQRAAAIAEAEGLTKIEPSHFERILPQLLLDF